MNLSQIFVIFDKDSAGNRGAQQLVRLGSKLINIQLPPGAWKDVNEFILAGGDLWQLLKASIDLSRLSPWVR